MYVVGDPKNSGGWGPPMGVGIISDPLGTSLYLICVTLLNLVALGQSVWAQVGVPKNLEHAGPNTLGLGRG